MGTLRTADAIVSNASRVKPPEEGLFPTPLSVTAATASVATATGVATYGPGWYTFACDSAFWIVFSADGTTTITAPSNLGVLTAGAHDFWLDGDNAYFKVTATSTGTLAFWKSSVGVE